MMGRSRPVLRAALSAIAVALTLGLAAPALACSDLENICEQQRQHYLLMDDLARASAEQQAEEADEANWSDDNGGDFGAAPQNPMQARMDVAFGMAQLAAKSVAEQARLKSDPRYQAYLHGGWEYFQSRAKAAPGEYCAAMFWNQHGVIALTGPGGAYDGAFLLFTAEGIPAPRDIEKIEVTLSQPDDPPQTVRVFNYMQPGAAEGYGTIAFAVPTIEAALAGMVDKQSFVISLRNATVFDMSWHGGLAARDQLSRCLRKKR